MIRRNVDKDEWLLIRQMDHARISYDLALAWSEEYLPEAGRGCSEEEQRVVLQAILRHDDGWAEFDRVPRPHLESGNPMNFTERSNAQAHDIWTKCIELAADLAPLGTLMIAEHFLSFRRDVDCPIAREFAAVFEPRCLAWRSEYLEGASEVQLQERLGRIPFFDLLSLRLCCTLPAGPVALELGGLNFELAPTGDSEFEWTIDPWPFGSVLGEEIVFQSPSARVSRAEDWSRVDWSSEPDRWSETLKWRICPK